MLKVSQTYFTSMHKNIQTHIYKYIYTCIHIYTYTICAYTHIHTHIYKEPDNVLICICIMQCLNQSKNTCLLKHSFFFFFLLERKHSNLFQIKMATLLCLLSSMTATIAIVPSSSYQTVAASKEFHYQLSYTDVL